MSAEENKALVRRFYVEFFNKGNLDIVEELHSADFRHYDSGAPDPGGGPEGYKRHNAVLSDGGVAVQALLQVGNSPGDRADFSSGPASRSPCTKRCRPPGQPL
jgi:hypothetical protein